MLEQKEKLLVEEEKRFQAMVEKRKEKLAKEAKKDAGKLIKSTNCRNARRLTIKSEFS